MKQPDIAKKELRKNVRSVGLASLIYAIIGVAVVLLFYAVIPYLIPEAGVGGYISNVEKSGVPSIIMNVIGILFFFFFFRKKGIHKELFVKENGMTFSRGKKIFCLYAVVYALGVVMTLLAEFGLNAVGFTGNMIAPVANGQTTTISMFLYASIIGPIAEELIWRGFLFRALHKYGKTTAVVVTSVLFGLMHGNIPQTISATMFGLLLGYITAEYSIKWSMALHVFHNSVLCSIQLFMSNADIFTALYLLALFVFAIIGVVLVICKRKISQLGSEAILGKSLK